MSSPAREETVIGTFAETRNADLAADAARHAGFQVERRSGAVVAVQTGQHPQHAGEIRGILAAYGAREYAPAGTADSPTSGEQRTRAEQGTQIDLVEEQLRARTHSVQTGEITIRKGVVSETRTIEVPVRREELVVERHPVERRAVDSADTQAGDPLVAQLIDRLRHMQPGQTLRIPIIEEEVVVHRRPVVVEEITVGKRILEDTQKVSETVRREEAHIEPHGRAPLHDA